MKKKLATVIFASVMLVLSALPVSADSQLEIDGFSMTIPDTWVETSREDTDDSTKIMYTCPDGGVQIFTTNYDESLASVSGFLLDAGLYGLKEDGDFEELDSSNVKAGGKTGHLTVFKRSQHFGALFAVDSGKSIINMMYVSASESGGNSSEEFATIIDTMQFNDDSAANTDSIPESEGRKFTTYSAGMYKVDTDIPSGEYVVFADGGTGYFCVSSDSNQENILFNENFDYNSIITINSGEYLDLSRCHAIPLSENPRIKTDSSGMFKVGLHMPAGEYKLESDSDRGYYCIYSDSRQNDIIANDNFSGQNYVTISDGQYLLLSRCHFTNPPINTYTDVETVTLVQEKLNSLGYDCGTPDGSAGPGTQSAIKKFQTDKNIEPSGTITDTLLDLLGL